MERISFAKFSGLLAYRCIGLLFSPGIVPNIFFTAPVAYISWWVFILHTEITMSASVRNLHWGALTLFQKTVGFAPSKKSTQVAPVSSTTSQIPQPSPLNLGPGIPGESPHHIVSAPFSLTISITAFTTNGLVVMFFSAFASERIFGLTRTFLPFTSGKSVFSRSVYKLLLISSYSYFPHFVMATLFFIFNLL